MVKFINKTTGTEMLVADERVEEYKAAGHTVADTLKATTEVNDTEAPEEKKAKRKTTKEQ